MKTLINVFALLLLCSASLLAQPGIDLRFVPVEGENPDLYCVNVQVQGNNGADYIGISSIRIGYNFEALNFSGSSSSGITVGTYQEINFGDNNGSDPNFPLAESCTVDGGGIGASPYSQHGFDGLFPGDILLTLVLQSPSIDLPTGPLVFACPNVDEGWVDVSQVCFEVLDPGGDPNLQFIGAMGDPAGDESGTNFNTSFNDPTDKYWNGNFETLNISYNDFYDIDSVDGCTDPTACNYDPNATVNDGSCTYPVAGCDCFSIVGCGDPLACNYNPNACDNGFGECVYPDCEGNCSGTAITGTPCDDGDPSTNEDMWNENCECIGDSSGSDTQPDIDLQFVPIETENPDLYCVNVQVQGSDGADYLGISSIRINYDFETLNFSGSSVSGINVGTYQEINFGANDGSDPDFPLAASCTVDGGGLGASPYSAHGFDGLLPGDILLTLVLQSPSIDTPNGPLVFACPNVDNGWVDVSQICFEVLDPDGDPNLQFVGAIGDSAGDESGSNFNNSFNDSDDKYWNGTFTSLNSSYNTLWETSSAGCTDVTACNYDATATEDDGSCNLPDCEGNCLGGDTGPAVPGSACDDGDATTANDVYDVNCECLGAQIPGCTDATACNFDNNATLDDGSCNLPDCEGNCTGMNTGPSIIGSSCSDGDPTTFGEVWNSNCECTGGTMIEILGCTNPCAFNFNPIATQDNGTCNFPDCVDACPLTEDFFDEVTCECVNLAPVVDDGCALTTDSFDATNCAIINTPPDPNDNCAFTIDSFDAVNCEIINEPISPPDDGCDLTTFVFDENACQFNNELPTCDDGDPTTVDSFDAANCLCINGVNPVFGCTNTCADNYDVNATEDDGSCVFPTCDDGCEFTTDTFDDVTCDCIFTEPTIEAIDDGCPLTIDSFDADNCIILNTPPDPDDGCPLTIDSFDAANCSVINQQPDCDDGDPSTTDTYIASNCECENSLVAIPGCSNPCALNYDPTVTLDDGTCFFPDPDDGCDETNDSFDIITCVITNEPPNPDDGCPLTIDSFDSANCLVVNQAPNCDDGNPNTTDFFDALNCVCENTIAVIPGCTNPCALNYDPTANFDDGSCVFPDPNDGCPLTTDSFDPISCVVINTPPVCDDGSCATEDVFDPLTCECVYTQVFDCDDGCPLTNDFYDEVDCECVYEEPSLSDIDDGCPLTIDSFDPNTCEIVNTPPFAADIDDGCALTTEQYDAASCLIVITPPNCDDGDPTTVDLFDATNCTCVSEPFIEGGCTNPCAINYNPNATIDDGSCEYPDCNDGCPLTTDSFNNITCFCEYTEPTAADIDDGCPLTTDSYDAANCQIINEPPSNPCPFVVFNSATCAFDGPDPDDGCPLTTDIFDAANCLIINVPPDCDDGDPLTDDIFNVFNCECNNIMIDDFGCTDPCATNYDPTAITDDGSCVPYDTTCDTDACTNGGSYIWDAIVCDCVLEQATVDGCTSATACNYDAAANCDDGSCEFLSCQIDLMIVTTVSQEAVELGENITITITVTNDGPGDASGVIAQALLADGLNYVSHDNAIGTYDPDSGTWNIENLAANTNTILTIVAATSVVGNYTNTIQIIAANEEDLDSSPNNNNTGEDDQDNTTINVNFTPVEGCTDPTACNFNPDANVENNTCFYAPADCTCDDVYGCTDASAENYNPDATCDDGSCFAVGISTIQQTNPILIYPNPSNSDLNLDFGLQVPQSIRFFDLNGAVVYQAMTVYDKKMKLSVESWAQGVYILAVQYEEGIVWEKVVVK